MACCHKELQELHFFYGKKIADEYKIKVDDVKKLIQNLGRKTNYAVHYRNLQLYLSLGMTKIHKSVKI